MDSAAPTRCLNCDAHLSGPFCHECGQKGGRALLPFREFAGDVLDAAFSLDNRLWRTLAQLLRRPGSLTQAYLSGRRVRYLTPVRLYLITSLVYFLLAELLGEVDLMFVSSTSDSSMATTLPRVMFVIVPTVGLLLAGLYWKRGALYVAHLTFALHLHAGWYVIFSASLILSQWIPPPEALPDAGVLIWVLVGLGMILRVGILVYTFVSLRKVYAEGRWLTALKTTAFLVGYMILLGGGLFLYIALFS